MFFNKVGKMALGSRLKMLSESIMEDAKQIYQMYGIDLKPKWFPVFYVLSHSKNKSITVIAREIGHSHPSVSKIVSEMSKEKIVAEKMDKKDGRKNILELTQKGKDIAIKIENQYIDVNNAVEEALGQTRHNMWKAMEELEFLLHQKSMLRRVQEQKKQRESKKVKIVPYQSKFLLFFKELNEAWITTNFKMEKEDYKALEDPEKYILDKGGHILVALYNNEPVGV